MINYIINRILYSIPIIFIISLITFSLIQLPPGSYLDTVIVQMTEAGVEVDEAYLESLKERYALDKSFIEQYYKWIKDIILEFEFGRSWLYERPIIELIGERLPWTLGISMLTFLFIWLISFPISVYSATHKYSLGDNLFTFLGFLGLGVPNFLFALILMWIGFRYFGIEIGGLFSEEYRNQNWSLGKLLDLLKHMWVPVIVLGTAGTAELIRTTRAVLLDELKKPYVTAALARGLSYNRVVWKYPVKFALNPFVSSIGLMMPMLISGSAIVSIVLSLPTIGPLQIRALMAQDMYLAGDILLLQSTLVVAGTIISDILLAIIDPRIRYKEV